MNGSSVSESWHGSVSQPKLVLSVVSTLAIAGAFDVRLDSPKAFSFSSSLTAMPASSVLPEQATWTKLWSI